MLSIVQIPDEGFIQYNVFRAVKVLLLLHFLDPLLKSMICIFVKLCPILIQKLTMTKYE